MAELTEKQQRENFAALLNQAPHNARMNEHAKRFIERLGKVDREKLLSDALEQLWTTREGIKETADVLKLWIKALEYAAKRRLKWKTFFNVYEVRWVRGTQLGRQS